MRIGIDKTKFAWCFWKRICASFALYRIVMKIRNRVHSVKMLVKLVMAISDPYQFRLKGHRSCVPPIVRSAIECWAKDAKYGTTAFPSVRKAGRKRRKNTIMEWLGPLCIMPGIKRSTSDITEATNIRGTFASVLRILDAVFPIRYPRAK